MSRVPGEKIKPLIRAKRRSPALADVLVNLLFWASLAILFFAVITAEIQFNH